MCVTNSTWDHSWVTPRHPPFSPVTQWNNRDVHGENPQTIDTSHKRRGTSERYDKPPQPTYPWHIDVHSAPGLTKSNTKRVRVRRGCSSRLALLRHALQPCTTPCRVASRHVFARLAMCAPCHAAQRLHLNWPPSFTSGQYLKKLKLSSEHHGIPTNH